MFVVNEDLSIYATRGDCVHISVTAENAGGNHVFQPGDVVRFKVFDKKGCDNVVLQKDFPVTEETEIVSIALTKEDTKLGEVISKPKDYWYEIELNPFDVPATIIGYDEDGAKVFKLFPEGEDLEEFVPEPEDIPVVDKELDMTSTRPVQNQAIARAFVSLNAACEKTDAKSEGVAEAIKVEKARLDNLVASGTPDGAEVIDIRAGADGKVYPSAGAAVREQIAPLAKQVKVKNLIDFKKLMRGYIGSDGWIQNYNNAYHVTNEVTTDFIKVKATGSYYFGNRFGKIATAIKESNAVTSNHDWCGISLYDATKTFMKRIQYNVPGIVLPASVFEGATYVRLSYRTYLFNHPVFAECGVPCEAMDEIVVSDNLLETYPMIFNGYVGTDGAVIGTTHNFQGYIPSVHDEMTSEFIPCTGGEEMFIFSTAEHSNWIRVAFYRADGHFVSSISYGPTSIDNVGTADYDNFLETFVVPDNAVALRVSCRGAYITECVLAHNDRQRKYLYKQCERNYKSKYAKEASAAVMPVHFIVKAVAHRGCSAEAPENTLAAYRLAAKNNFEYVECDISFTSDDVAVLLHDSTIDRTSDGTGSIASMTLEEARGYDFGSWFSADYAGEKIPTGAEFVSLCRRLGLHPYIEVKDGTKEQIQSFVATVKQYGMLRKVTWISFFSTCLEYVREADPSARLGFVVGAIDQNVVNTALGLKNDVNEVFVDTGTVDANVSLCIDADIPVECWTVDSEDWILSMNPYISGVTSNYTHAGKVLYNAEIGD